MILRRFSVETIFPSVSFADLFPLDDFLHGAKMMYAYWQGKEMVLMTKLLTLPAPLWDGRQWHQNT